MLLHGQFDVEEACGTCNFFHSCWYRSLNGQTSRKSYRLFPQRISETKILIVNKKEINFSFFWFSFEIFIPILLLEFNIATFCIYLSAILILKMYRTPKRMTCGWCNIINFASLWNARLFEFDCKWQVIFEQFQLSFWLIH